MPLFLDGVYPILLKIENKNVNFKPLTSLKKFHCVHTSQIILYLCGKMF